MLPRLFAAIALLSAAACDAPPPADRAAQPAAGQPAAARPAPSTSAPLSMGAGGY